MRTNSCAASPACAAQRLHRIRHYGLIANAGRRENLVRARELLGVERLNINASLTEADASGRLVQPTFVCPCCGAAMTVIQIPVRGQPIRAPPQPQRHMMTSTFPRFTQSSAPGLLARSRTASPCAGIAQLLAQLSFEKRMTLLHFLASQRYRCTLDRHRHPQQHECRASNPHSIAVRSTRIGLFPRVPPLGLV